jgi:hypothetical protein
MVLGGRVARHQGKYPGILEEASLTLGVKPLFIIGAFGAVLTCLPVYCGTRRRQRPSRANINWHILGSPNGTPWMAARKRRPFRFEQLEESYRRHEHDPETGEGPINYQGLLEQVHQATIGDLKSGAAYYLLLMVFAIMPLVV